MKLNRFEAVLMDSPLRWATQRFLDVTFFQPDWRGGRILEIGCGNGRGVEMVLDLLGADEVLGFDLDPEMLVKAGRRLKGRDGVHLWLGDVNKVALGDGVVDGVVDFGMLHHVPDWQGAVGEVYRVLKPGGYFYVFEVLEAFIRHPVWRVLMDHPQGNRFDADGFARGLVAKGFRVGRRRQVAGQVAWYVAEKRAGEGTSLSIK